MTDDAPDDDVVDKLLEEEFYLANKETQKLLAHWGRRNANPMIVTPVLVTAMFTLIRAGFDKSQYDDMVRNILAAVETDAEENNGGDDGYRRSVH